MLTNFWLVLASNLFKMNTIGRVLNEARIKQNITLSSLERITKIKKDFIRKIENEDWDNLPEFPVVSGFVKNIGGALNLSVNNVNAILRRDYPPKKLKINPNPDIAGKFIWSPKMAFAVGISALALIVLVYLGFEYRRFTLPPELVVKSPTSGQVFNQKKVKILGKTTTDVVLTVNNQPVFLNQDGEFSETVEVSKETKELKFVATSRSGKVTEKKIDINVE